MDNNGKMIISSKKAFSSFFYSTVNKEVLTVDTKNLEHLSRYI